MNQGLLWLAWVIPAFISSSLLTHFLIGWASRAGVLDQPNERSSHTKVMPRGGGLSIVVVTSIAAVISAVAWPESRAAIAGLIAASLGIAYVSWLDDLKPLPNRIRFSVHVLAAVVVAMLAHPIQVVDVGGLGTLSLGYAAWPLTLLWIVGMTNAFNFMDGIDGIAGVTAASAGFAIAVAAACLGCHAVAAVAMAFGASSLGFLTCNWPPAKVFMGDVGSAYCGFVIAALPAIPSPEPTSRLVAVALFAMWPFIFDTIFTLMRRLANGENVFEAHRSHLYQRCVIAGWSHRSTTLLYGLLSAIAAGISLVPFFNDAATPVATKAGLMYLAASAVLLLILVYRAESARTARVRQVSRA
jgi:UDP-N-acetylmuramyl pentapeptide phosphotransferase/UDP-N-acetylglucosamine-1-phosphate transferase